MQPNIVLIMADQIAPQVLAAYGGRVVQSPNIDGLAEGGAVFDNAYCNYPICAPARFSMLTGQLPSRIGAYDNAAELPASIPTFVHYLRAHGYRSCLAGKMHFVGPDQLHGYEERVTTDVYPSDFNWTANWRLGESTWVPWYHSMRAILDAGPWPRSVNVAFDDEVEFEAVRWLHDASRDDDQRPFFLTVSLISPHDPYLAPQDYWNRYRDEDIDMPQVPDMPLEQRDDHSRRLYYVTGRHLDEVTDVDLRRARRAYYAMTSYVDDKVGAVLRALKDTGVADNTIVIFTGDHGDMLGERGLYFKMCFFEWSVRVPLIIHAPGTIRAGRITQNVSLVDLFPTILDLAVDGGDVDLVEPVAGGSLGPLMGGSTRDWPDVVFSEYTAEGTAAPLFMVKQGHYKYIYGERDAPLLYKLDDDPRELVNLAGNPLHLEAESRLREAVFRQWSPMDIARKVEQSQRTRLFLHQSLNQGRHAPWDYQPYRDAARQYFRTGDAVQQSYVTAGQAVHLDVES